MRLRMATSGICQHLLAAFLSLHLLALPGSSVISGTEANGTSRLYPLYMKFEEALVKNKSSLYKLRDLFFSPVGLIREVQCFKIELHITAMIIMPPNSTVYSVNKAIANTNDTNNSFYEYDFGCQTYQWSTSFLSAILSADILAILEPIYTVFMYSKMVGSFVHKSAWIHLNLSSLDSLPTDECISSASVLLVTWAKAFAKANGNPVVWDEADSGYITKWYDYFTSEGIHHRQRKYAHYFRITFMIAFAAINLAIPFTFAVLRNRLCVWAPLTSSINRSILYTVITIVTGYNILYVIFCMRAYFFSSIVACILGQYSKCSLPLDSQHYKDQVMVLVIKGIITLLTLGISLALAVLYSKQNKLPMPCLLPRSVNRVPVLTQFLRKISHTLAVWSMMVTVQIMVGSSLMPIGILLIVSPLFAISIIGSLLILLVDLFICVHLIVSSFCSTHSLQRKCKTFLVRIAGCFLFTTILVATTMFYDIVILMGSNNRGFRGTLLSLLPPVLFSFICWLIRNKLLKTRYTMLPGNRNQQVRNNSMEAYYDNREQMMSDYESLHAMIFNKREERTD